MAIAKEGENEKVEKAMAEAREKIAQVAHKINSFLQELGIEMVQVERGTFMMGSEKGRDNERPIHEVTLNSYEIGKFPITQAQWEMVMGSNPSHFSSYENCPIKNVSWKMPRNLSRN